MNVSAVTSNADGVALTLPAHCVVVGRMNPRTGIDGKSYATLRITDRPTDEVTIAVDNNTKLIRRVTLDLRKSVEKRGAPDIKSADFAGKQPTVLFFYVGAFTNT